MVAYELQQHDVISYKPPQPHKQKYKIRNYISVYELDEAIFGSHMLKSRIKSIMKNI